MPVQSALPWYTIIPIAESCSSYNGLLVFLFITISTLITVQILHRFASRALRAPAGDCGYLDPSPFTQYSAGSVSQPIRRVFGSACFTRATSSKCRRPVHEAGPRFHVWVLKGYDPWSSFYASDLLRFVLRRPLIG